MIFLFFHRFSTPTTSTSSSQCSKYLLLLLGSVFRMQTLIFPVFLLFSFFLSFCFRNSTAGFIGALELEPVTEGSGKSIHQTVIMCTTVNGTKSATVRAFNASEFIAQRARAFKYLLWLHGMFLFN